MAVELQDILKANLVLLGLDLLKTEEELAAFRRDVGMEVVDRPLPNINVSPGNTVTPRALTLDRERTVLEMSPIRTVVHRNYPDVKDFDRISEIAALAIDKTDLTGSEPTVLCGYNLDLVFSQDSDPSAFTYLADRLFDVGLSQGLEWPLSGGSADLVFVDPARHQWTFTVQPRAFDPSGASVYLSLNRQIDSPQPIPHKDEITQSLLECREQAIKFMSVLDGRR